MIEQRLPLALLLLRLGVFLVMLVWTLDKFVNPAHAAGVYETFYFLGGFGSTLMTVIGVVELVVVVAFVLGILKTWTYGAVLVLHAISTLSTWKLYLQPFDNLLFFAAWPMLAACFALFWLRDADTLSTVGGGRSDALPTHPGQG